VCNDFGNRIPYDDYLRAFGVSAHDGRLKINDDPRLSGGTMIVYGDGVEVFHATPERDVDPSELLKSLTAITTRRPLR